MSTVSPTNSEVRSVRAGCIKLVSEQGCECNTNHCNTRAHLFSYSDEDDDSAAAEESELSSDSEASGVSQSRKHFRQPLKPV